MGQRPDEEGSSSRAAFVRQGLDVGVAGMVVHGHMEEIETEAGAALRTAVGLGEARQDALAPPCGMQPSFLMSRWTSAPGWACS